MSYILANERLFNRWRSLGLRVAALAWIVQNDSLDLSDRTVAFQIKDWKDDTQAVERIFSELTEETLKYLDSQGIRFYDSH